MFYQTFAVILFLCGCLLHGSSVPWSMLKCLEQTQAPNVTGNTNKTITPTPRPQKNMDIVPH